MLKLWLKVLMCFWVLAGITVFLHVKRLNALQSKADRVYSLNRNHQYLFIGSSEIGCSIEEGTNWQNRVSWVSDAVTETFLMRLREFERRGQLSEVKKVIVPFNFVAFPRQKADKIKWSWYKELPVAIRYLDMLPCSKVEFLCYIARNLRYPLPFLLQSGFPPAQCPVAKRPVRKRATMLRAFETEGKSIVLGHDVLPDWEGRIMSAYVEMSAICKKHGIEFVVLHVPVLPQYQQAVNADVLEQEKSFMKRFEERGMKVLTVKEDFSDAQYRDNIHMTEAGRSVFTARVMAALRQEP